MCQTAGCWLHTDFNWVKHEWLQSSWIWIKTRKRWLWCHWWVLSCTQFKACHHLMSLDSRKDSDVIDPCDGNTQLLWSETTNMLSDHSKIVIHAFIITRVDYSVLVLATQLWPATQKRKHTGWPAAPERDPGSSWCRYTEASTLLISLNTLLFCLALVIFVRTLIQFI